MNIMADSVQALSLDLQRSDATNGHFSDADLRYGRFDEAILRGASFDGAHLQQTLMWRADLTNASFRRANLSAADLAFTNLEGVDFSGANLTNARLDGAQNWKRIKSLTGANVFSALVPNSFMRWALGSMGAVCLDTNGQAVSFADCLSSASNP
jgi:uncharacterized protein YjbI with pentapeptide repeats